MLHFSSSESLQKIWSVMNKWYHTLVGTLQTCSFVASQLDLATKNWVLASSDGYPYKFETYTGACDTKDSSKPLGPQAVSALLLILENPACYCVYFDNFLHIIIYCKICTKKISGVLGL